MEFFDLFIRARHTPLVSFPVRPVFTSHAYHSLGRAKSAHHSLFFAFFPHQASCLGLLFYFSAWRFNPQGAGLCCIFGLEYLFFPLLLLLLLIIDGSSVSLLLFSLPLALSGLYIMDIPQQHINAFLRCEIACTSKDQRNTGIEFRKTYI